MPPPAVAPAAAAAPAACSGSKSTLYSRLEEAELRHEQMQSLEAEIAMLEAKV